MMDTSDAPRQPIIGILLSPDAAELFLMLVGIGSSVEAGHRDTLHTLHDKFVEFTNKHSTEHYQDITKEIRDTIQYVMSDIKRIRNAYTPSVTKDRPHDHQEHDSTAEAREQP